MSYEYMRGLGAFGAEEKRKSLEPGDAQELVKEACDSIGCIGLTSQPVIFQADHEKSAQMVSNMMARGCFMQCSQDNVNYYCCPPLETETAVERQERIEGACGGGDICSEPLMRKRSAARSDTIRGQDRAEYLLGNGCEIACEEDGWTYFCCPSTQEHEDSLLEEAAAEEAAAIEAAAALLPPPEPPAGFPWGAAILGLLVLGGAGFAGYWFLIRDKDEEEDDKVVDDEVVEGEIEQEKE